MLAQWSRTNGPFGGSIAAKDNIIFAGTNEAGAFYSIDNGTNWFELRNGLPPGQFSSIIVSSDYLISMSPRLEFHPFR